MANDRTLTSNPSNTLLQDALSLLRQMRDDVFQRGEVSGRSQSTGETLIHRIGVHLSHPVPVPGIPLRKIPTAWMRGIPPINTPDGPGEWDVDFSYGDDRPEGSDWVPLYRRAAPETECRRDGQAPNPVAEMLDQVSIDLEDTNHEASIAIQAGVMEIERLESKLTRHDWGVHGKCLECGMLKANEPLPISATGVGRDAYLKAWDTLSQADRDEWIKRGLGQ